MTERKTEIVPLRLSKTEKAKYEFLREQGLSNRSALIKVFEQGEVQKLKIRQKTLENYSLWLSCKETVNDYAKKHNLSLQEAKELHGYIFDKIRLERQYQKYLTEQEEGPFFCKECEAGPFKTKAKLKAHYKENHPEIFRALYKSGRRIG